MATLCKVGVGGLLNEIVAKLSPAINDARIGDNEVQIADTR